MIELGEGDDESCSGDMIESISFGSVLKDLNEDDPVPVDEDVF